jgi:hypothetical protein
MNPRWPVPYALPHDRIDIYSGYNKTAPLYDGPSLRPLRSRAWRSATDGRHNPTLNPQSSFHNPAIAFQLAARQQFAKANGTHTPFLEQTVNAFHSNR